MLRAKTRAFVPIIEQPSLVIEGKLLDDPGQGQRGSLTAPCRTNTGSSLPGSLGRRGHLPEG